MKVVDKFEYCCGYKFFIYVIWWICQVIICLIVDQVCIICILVYMIEMINKFNCIFCQMFQEMGCEFILEEFGECMDMFEDKICKVLKIVKELIFMEILIGDDEDLYLGDFIEDFIMQLLIEMVISESFKEFICEVFVGFIVWEVKVLCMCFGIDMNIDYIFEEVGKQFDVICEWICQIEVKVLCKLCYLL